MLRAIFPPLNTIENRYQILRRIPVLLPLMWVLPAEKVRVWYSLMVRSFAKCLRSNFWLR